MREFVLNNQVIEVINLITKNIEMIMLILIENELYVCLLFQRIKLF